MKLIEAIRKQEQRWNRVNEHERREKDKLFDLLKKQQEKAVKKWLIK